jgi:hypothetical protein
MTQLKAGRYPVSGRCITPEERDFIVRASRCASKLADIALLTMDARIPQDIKRRLTQILESP